MAIKIPPEVTVPKDANIPDGFEMEEVAGLPCACSFDGCEADGWPFAIRLPSADFSGYVEACAEHALVLALDVMR